MNQEVTDFIEALREVVHQAVSDVHERIQYKKPHFLKNGKYAAVISTSKDAVSFTIFHAAGLELPDGMFDGPPERKTMKLRKGDPFDSGRLASWVGQASSSI